MSDILRKYPEGRMEVTEGPRSMNVVERVEFRISQLKTQLAEMEELHQLMKENPKLERLLQLTTSVNF